MRSPIASRGASLMLARGIDGLGASTELGRPAPQSPRSVTLGVRLTDVKHDKLDLAVAKLTGDPAVDNPARKVRLSVPLSDQLAAP